MEKENERTLLQGVATHDDPELCVDVWEGGGEVLTGARAGRGIVLRHQGVRVFTPATRLEDDTIFGTVS